MDHLYPTIVREEIIIGENCYFKIHLDNWLHSFLCVLCMDKHLKDYFKVYYYRFHIQMYNNTNLEQLK